MLPYLKWRIRLFWRWLCLLLMVSRISYYSLNRFLRYWGKGSRRNGLGVMLILIIRDVVLMVSHVALRSSFAIFKWVSSVILFSFHLLRRASFHYTSVLRIIIVNRHRWRVSISMLLLLVVVIVIILRQWRRHIVTMMVGIRWWRRISIIIVILLRMMLPPLIWIHIRVLIWRCRSRKLVILERLILMIIVWAIKLHPCVIGCCISCWSGRSEATWSKITVVKLWRILLTLSSVHSCGCCGRRTMISGVASVFHIFFVYKIQSCVLIL